MGALEDRLKQKHQAINNQNIPNNPDIILNENNLNEEISSPKKKEKKQKKAKKSKEKNVLISEEKFDIYEQKTKDNPLSKLSQNRLTLNNPSAEDFDKLIESEYENKVNNELKNEKKSIILSKIAQVALILACIYLCFLIYGAVMTSFAYSDKGNVEPVVLSVPELSEKKNYEMMYSYYLQTRALYEEILDIDYRLSTGLEDPLVLATEYTEIYTKVDSLGMKIDAADVDTKYTQIQKMLCSWIANDVEKYLTNVSQAISENNSKKESLALKYKSAIEADYAIITENIIANGRNIKGFDTKEAEKWSPNEYIQEKIVGLEDK